MQEPIQGRRGQLLQPQPTDGGDGQTSGHPGVEVTGHLVRRRDPVWGERGTAAQANRDTFAYTNAAPQAAGFNQSDQLWLGLENYLLEAADATNLRLSTLTGCVFDPSRPALPRHPTTPPVLEGGRLRPRR
ncbi:DNA/RNA non-specific endonuclease [Auraticoccus cholistanensis]|uniref:DNA/RNA non-specific endonuclease n=1 Tax=Auraticoccus cholistanensis TaxID=2656650 RepID=UPI0018D2135E